MTLKTKIEYIRLALGLAGLPVNRKTSELIIKVYEKVLEKKGSFNLTDAVKIEQQVLGKRTRKKIVESKQK